MRKSLFFLFSILIFMSISFAYTLDGNYVWFQNSNAKINCTAYSNELTHQSQICEFLYLGSGNPTINTSFVFNLAEGVTPKKAYLWKNTSHVVYEPQNISVNHSIVVSGMVSTSTDPCDWGSCGIKRKLTDINGTTKTYCFSSFVNNSNNYTLYCNWNEEVSAPVVRYWDDWEDVSSAFDMSQFGSYRVGTVQSSWTTGQSRRVRIDYSTLPNTDGKFDIYFHTGSAQEAKADPSKVKLVLDPWYDSNWQYRKEIQWNSTVSSVLVNFTGYIVVDTSIPISQGKMKNDCSDLRIANTTDALFYEIENNTCNTNFTTIFYSIPATTASGNNTLYEYYGNPSATDAQNRNAVWRNAGYVGVWHFSEAVGLFFDSAGYNNLLNGTEGTASYTNSIRSNLGYGVRLNSYDNTNKARIYVTNPVGLPSGSPTVKGWTATWFMNKTTNDQPDGSPFWVLGTQVVNQLVYINSRTSPTVLRSGGWGTIEQTTVNYQPYNTWQHFAVNSTSDAQETFWKNGTLVNTYNADIASIGTDSFSIGGNPDTAGDWSNLTITEFRWRNQSSSVDWITAEYAQAYFLKDEEANITNVKNISFISQIPSDLTSTNLFSLRLNITYNATYTNSTPYIFYKINSTSYDGLSFLNGTRIVGWQNKTCTNQTVSSVSPVTWLCQLDDNEVYPATYNIDEEYIESAEKSNTSLSSTSDAFKMEFYNVSNSSAYSFFEIYAFNITPAVNPLRFFYCNSSYTTGNIGTSGNCIEFATLARTTAFNHTHSVASKHHVLPLGLNTTSGRIGTVKVSPTSYIIARGATNNGWNVSYISNISRITAYQTTTNLGTTWANLSGTADAHIHQFGDADTLYYFGSVAPSGETWSEANATNSTVRNDLIQLGGLSPSDAVIITPTNTTYYRNSNIMINYTSAISPNGYDISFYNISLLNTDLSFSQTIRTNNSLNLTFDWNISAIATGQYVIMINTTDNNSLSSLGFSEPFNIVDVNSVYFVSPTPDNQSNSTASSITLNATSSSNMTSCLYDIDGVNQTGTIASNNASCSYIITPSSHNHTYNYTVWTNLSGTMTQANETRQLTWYNASNCLVVTNAFNITQNTSSYIKTSDTTLYVVAQYLELNNTCVASISNYDYNIVDGVADGNWTTQLVSLSASELKNTSNYSYRIPITWTDLGTHGSYVHLSYDNTRHYNLTTAYGRNISNMMVNLTKIGDRTGLFRCQTNTSCPLSDSGIWSSVSFTTSSTNLLRTGDILGDVLSYAITYEFDDNPSPNPGGGSGSSSEQPTNNSTSNETISEDSGNIPEITSLPRILGLVNYLVMLFGIFGTLVGFAYFKSTTRYGIMILGVIIIIVGAFLL